MKKKSAFGSWTELNSLSWYLSNLFCQGYCTEFNVAAGVIKNHLEAKCNETYPRCDKAYSSADAYKCRFNYNPHCMCAGHFFNSIFFFKWKHILMIIVLKSFDLDCYQIVYDKRKTDFTTYLQTTLVHSKDKEDNG